MLITLKPVSHPELDDIVIENGLFHVGRLEKPFCDLPPKLIESLSRRQARIFMQDSTPYIADLGSSNGTTVNEKALEDTPSQLQQGDIINFAGDLSYRVALDSAVADERTRLVNPSSIRLNLSSQNNDVDSIQVSKFPFLISKDSEVFLKYKDSVPEELGFLSRRHAHIYEQEGNLYIEDLGSTNGTFLNGKQLNERQQSLSRGDRIGFGGEYFIFKLDIAKVNEDNSDGASHTASQFQSAGNQNTTFISTATSFLDIFCVEEKIEKVDTSEDRKNPEINKDLEEKESEKAEIGPASHYRRARGFIAQIKGALTDDEAKSSHRRKYLAGLILLTITMLSFWYFLNREERYIEFLCEEKNYSACIQAADSYLADHKDKKDSISELATKALLKSFVPEWISHLKNNDLESANTLLVKSRSYSSNHQEGQNILKLLERVATLDGFVHQRGGPEGPIQIYSDEETIINLVEEWRTNSDADRRLMAKVVEHVPEFESLRGKVFSGLRHLRNDKSLYVAAIESFKSNLKEKIDNDDMALLKEIDKFSSRFPRVAGLEGLRQDAEKYSQLQQSKNSSDILNSLQAYQDLSFQTPLFQSELEQLKKDYLPPKEIAENFSNALKLWQKGMVVDAVQTLSKVTDETWQGEAQKILQRYENIASRYEALGGKQATDDYQDRLFVFHGSLDPEKDSFFLAAIEGEFIKYRDTSKNRADQLVKTATEGLSRYRNSGGIQSLQRLEEQVTEGFKKQSSLLSEINAQITQVQQVYKALKLELKQEQKALCKSIEQEMALQRRALKDLSSVLSNKVLESKLKLLEPVNTK